MQWRRHSVSVFWLVRGDVWQLHLRSSAYECRWKVKMDGNWPTLKATLALFTSLKVWLQLFRLASWTLIYIILLINEPKHLTSHFELRMQTGDQSSARQSSRLKHTVGGRVVAIYNWAYSTLFHYRSLTSWAKTRLCATPHIIFLSTSFIKGIKGF